MRKREREEEEVEDNDVDAAWIRELEMFSRRVTSEVSSEVPSGISESSLVEAQGGRKYED